MAKAADEREIAAQFVAALLRRQDRHPRGWVAQLARDTGIALTTLSHVVKGRRLPTVRQMLQISEALSAPEILPRELAQANAAAANPRISVDRGQRSDLPASVAGRPVPKDLVEYLGKRGVEDGVTCGELVEMVGSAFLEERDRPRSPDFYSGILASIRRFSAGAGSR